MAASCHLVLGSGPLILENRLEKGDGRVIVRIGQLGLCPKAPNLEAMPPRPQTSKINLAALSLTIGRGSDRPGLEGMC